MSKIQALAYVVAQSPEPNKWRTYGEQILGAAAATTPEGNVHVKLDQRQARIEVIKGAEDRFYASGWELADKGLFDDTVATLGKAGVAVTKGEPALAASRGFKELASFTDPSGNRHELVHTYSGPTAPFQSPVGVAGFKTGKFGAGHVVLPAMQFDATLKLFRDVLGFGLSDVFNFKPAPDAPNMRIYFLHAASGRHYSVALAEMPNPAGCVHIMVEVNSMTDVGLAHDRMQKRGVKLMATLGQHENDKMTSFYMMTPGNFALEYGWGGIEVNPATWRTTETKQVSIWGHDFSVGFR